MVITMKSSIRVLLQIITFVKIQLPKGINDKRNMNDKPITTKNTTDLNEVFL